ncbi:MAG: EamA family transporter RarD [Ideonella sp.]|nr:EamA family transporter RarD [Ideonella sp.]
MNSGIAYAALAYTLWGLFPIYFKQLQAVPPSEVLVHRIVWTLALVVALLMAMRRWSWLPAALRQPRWMAAFAVSAALLALNWLTYVWAVTSGHVVEASLGYFINPLFSALLGVTLLRERLRTAQWSALALAAVGVGWLTVDAGHLPWIALLLGSSFAVYGLLRKVATLGSLEGLTLETLLLAPVALLAFAWWTYRGDAVFPSSDAGTNALLLLSGPLTALTLLLFAAGARRITLTTLGLLQYISPTLQFALGVWVYREPFDAGRLVGFGLIWTALALYSAEGLWRRREAARVAG